MQFHRMRPSGPINQHARTGTHRITTLQDGIPASRLITRQRRFQMDDGGDLHEQILHTEAHIEELTDIIERCRKIILISKAAIAAGGILILAIIIGAVGFDPTILIGSLAAVIGGTVVFGSNASTLKQTMTDMKAAEAYRSELNDRMDLRIVRCT